MRWVWVSVCLSCVGWLKKKSGTGQKPCAAFFRYWEWWCGVASRWRFHDTSRIAWAKLLARSAEAFPLVCPACGGDIRLIAFITDPGPIRKILAHIGEPVDPPPVSPARGPPTDWGELVQVHDDRDVVQDSSDELPVTDIHSL